MATKDNSIGLLARMARLVRRPTTVSGVSENAEAEPDSGYSKQALKAMIERKRQNDYVRRREFDHLRKLRRNEPPVSADRAGRPSFFPSSLNSNLNGRATTLKKIDEIEAQMSKQWWKGRLEEASPPERSAGGQSDAHAGGAGSQDTVYGPTQMGLSAPGDLGPRVRASRALPMDSTADLRLDAGSSSFSPSSLIAAEAGDHLLDAELEEAAIRFANGDDAGAEAVLLVALQADPIEPEVAAVWAAALFDLYRVTGQQASFDRVALDYAQRFGRSAPGWFSTPDLLQSEGHPQAQDPESASGPSRLPVWACADRLDLTAVQAMQASLSSVAAPWRLDWSRLKVMTPEAAAALAPLFAQWGVLATKPQFDGADALENVLRACTHSGNRQANPCWWHLRLDALRILGQQDEFELAALDYCVTYEVSPPSWEDVPGQSVAAAQAGAAPRDPISQAHINPSAVVELSGELLGDARASLNGFQADLKGADRLVVSCTRLIRVDFSAAGSILNWVCAREAAGCHVQFHDVPCLVAAFFKVIGINEHAKVILRTT